MERVFIMGHEDKLIAAKEFMGNRWVLHKNYTFIPKHSQHTQLEKDTLRAREKVKVVKEMFAD